MGAHPTPSSIDTRPACPQRSYDITRDIRLQEDCCKCNHAHATLFIGRASCIQAKALMMISFEANKMGTHWLGKVRLLANRDITNPTYVAVQVEGCKCNVLPWRQACERCHPAC